MIDAGARGAVALGTLFAVAMAFYAVAVGLGDRRLRRHVRRAPVRTCAELIAAAHRARLVLLSGATAAGPGGPVVTPLSGRAVDWYRLTVWRAYDDGEGTATGALWRYDASPEFRVDDGTGVVPVAVELLDRRIDGDDAPPVLATKEFAKDRLDRLRRWSAVPADLPARIEAEDDVWAVEETLESGTPVTVFGRPARRRGGPRMVAARAARSGVAAGTPEDLRRRTAEQDRGNWSLVRVGGGIGLVLIAGGLPVHNLLAGHV